MGGAEFFRPLSPLLAGVFVLGGCDRKAVSPPTTQAVAVTMSATTKPATQPAAMLLIDGKQTLFPAARLVISKRAGGMEAILCSDDPPSAMDSGYPGNSFIFQMKLDVEDVDDLPSATWEFQTDRKEPQDSTDGIFVSGGRRQMQPFNVHVTFQKQGDAIVADVHGEFISFEPQDSAGRIDTVQVEGKLNAMVQQD